MARIFVSHATEDLYFVSLLEALLKFHYIDVWCGSSQIVPGADFSMRINAAVSESNILLVVASSNAHRSKWMTREITQFETEKPHGLMIPLRLDSSDLDSISPGLARYEAIDFSKSMLAGYEQLFSVLGKPFLTITERRALSEERRHGHDRRDGERRMRELLVRLRRGFTKSYFEKTRRGEFDVLNEHGKTEERGRVIYALTDEANKYSFYHAGMTARPTDVLDEIVYRVWARKEREGAIKAVYLVEAIAEEIFHSYDVKLNSERRANNRRYATDRRRPQTVGIA